MKTSYFARAEALKLENTVSVALYAPDLYLGRHFPLLAPPKDLLYKYKQDKDEKFYVQCYNSNVLEKLNPKTIFKALGEDSILLCWEGPTHFCHRRLIAKWFETNLGVTVPEL